jgi:hypothetical protein
MIAERDSSFAASSYYRHVDLLAALGRWMIKNRCTPPDFLSALAVRFNLTGRKEIADPLPLRRSRRD